MAAECVGYVLWRALVQLCITHMQECVATVVEWLMC